MPAAAPAHPLCFFTTTAWLGGAERSMLELAVELRRRDRTVLGLFPGGGGLAQAWSAAGLPFRPVTLPGLTRKLLQNPAALPGQAAAALKGLTQLTDAMRAAAGRQSTAVLLANSLAAAVYAALLPRLQPVLQPALAATLWHCRDLPERAGVGAGFAGAIYPHLTRVIAISATVAHSLAATGLPPEKLTVIRNGLNLPDPDARSGGAAAKRAARGALGLQQDLPTVLQVAQFTPWKKTSLFLESCRVAAEKQPLQVILVGRDPDPDAADDEIPMTIRLGLDRLRAQQVPVAHRPRADVKQMEQLFAAADLLVHTALNEPFGRVVLEAMARGLPVLARGLDGGGPAEQIAHEQTGWKVDHDDLFAPAIVQLLGDEALRAQLGAAARAEAHRIDTATHQPVHATARVATDLLRLLESL